MLFFTLVVQRKRWFRRDKEQFSSPFFFSPCALKVMLIFSTKKRTLIFFDMIILNRIYAKQNQSLRDTLADLRSHCAVSFCSFCNSMAILIWQKSLLDKMNKNGPANYLRREKQRRVKIGFEKLWETKMRIFTHSIYWLCG